MGSSLSFSVVSSTGIPYLTANIQNASQIPQYCTQLIEMFEKQPLFEGRGSRYKKCKVLPLDRYEDARICAIFSKNVHQMMGGKLPWSIHDFGCVEDQLSDSDDRWIMQGISLWLFDESERCSLETLQDSYNQVFKSMVTGWVQAKIEDNLDMMFKENTDKFMLFIKEKSFCEEDTLIRAIAIRLSLEADVKCDNKWLTHSGFKLDKSYLWLRKSALYTILDKFGFQFNKNQE